MFYLLVIEYSLVTSTFCSSAGLFLFYFFCLQVRRVLHIHDLSFKNVYVTYLWDPFFIHLFQGVTSDEETLEAATRTLNISDEGALDTSLVSTDYDRMDTSEIVPQNTSVTPNAADTPSNINDSLITPLSTCNVSTSSEVSESDLGSLVTTPSMSNEKKKRVSLADYRKRLQSRSGKPPSTSNDKCEAGGTSPALHPVFEPISPGDPEKQSGAASQNTLIEEFTRPSLSETVSETVSDESINPSKVRKLEFSSSVHDLKPGEVAGSQSPRLLNPPDNGNPLYHTLNGTTSNHTPPHTHALPEDTFSKIKEILSKSNPGLVPSGNLNVSQSILKTNLQMYDPNASSVKQYQYPSQYSDEMYNRETKRLKPSVVHSEYSTKYYKENEKR